MKVYYVTVHIDDFDNVNEGAHYFRKKSEALALLRDLKSQYKPDYDKHVFFQVMDIVVDSETIMNLLQGFGYADSVLDLDKP